METSYNITPNSSTPLWSSHQLIENPDLLKQAHRDFAQAGADVLLTATYQASFEGFAATPRVRKQNDDAEEGEDKAHIPHSKGKGDTAEIGYSREEAAEFMRHAVTLTRESFLAANRPTGLTALSLGAYGAAMRPSTEYSGAYQPSHMLTVPGLRAWHADRLNAFRASPPCWSAVDLVAFETLPRLEEIKAVRTLMRRANDGPERKKWWISAVFPNDDLNLPDGTPAEEAARAMIAEGVEEGGEQQPWGIGINCTRVQRLPALVEAYSAAVKKHVAQANEGEVSSNSCPFWLVLYPNASEGLAYNATKQLWEAAAEEVEVGEQQHTTTRKAWDEELFEIVQTASLADVWAGILVGGCCKTTFEDIRKLGSRLEGLMEEEGGREEGSYLGG